MRDLEKRQQVLDVGAVAQSGARGLVWEPVEVPGRLQDGSSAVCQQLQQAGFTAGLQALEACQGSHCTCIAATAVMQCFHSNQGKTLSQQLLD